MHLDINLILHVWASIDPKLAEAFWTRSPVSTAVFDPEVERHKFAEESQGENKKVSTWQVLEKEPTDFWTDKKTKLNILRCMDGRKMLANLFAICLEYDVIGQPDKGPKATTWNGA